MSKQVKLFEFIKRKRDDGHEVESTSTTVSDSDKCSKKK